MASPDADIPPQKDPDAYGIFGMLWQTVRQERMLSIVLAGVGLIAMMVIQLSKSGVTADGFQATFRAMLLPAAVISFVIFVMGGMRKTILGKALTALILIYLLAGMKQFLFAPYPPPMPPFYCFAGWSAEGCPGSPKYKHWALEEAAVEVVASSPASTAARDRMLPGLQDLINPVEPANPADSIFSRDPNAVDDTPTSSEDPAPEDAAHDSASERPLTADLAVSPGPVFTQFAGSLQRERIVALAQALSDQGWKMQGADRGGERTAAAAGINEVRFFYPEDRQYAEALAQAIIGIADWVPAMQVVDLSRSGYQPVRGQLEIWTSI